MHDMMYSLINLFIYDVGSLLLSYLRPLALLNHIYLYHSLICVYFVVWSHLFVPLSNSVNFITHIQWPNVDSNRYLCTLVYSLDRYGTLDKYSNFYIKNEPTESLLLKVLCKIYYYFLFFKKQKIKNISKQHLN